MGGFLPPRHARGVIRLAVNREANGLEKCQRRIPSCPKNIRSQLCLRVTQARPASAEFAHDWFLVCLLALGARRMPSGYVVRTRAFGWRSSPSQSRKAVLAARSETGPFYISAETSSKGESDTRRYYELPVSLRAEYRCCLPGAPCASPATGCSVSCSASALAFHGGEQEELQQGSEDCSRSGEGTACFPLQIPRPRRGSAPGKNGAGPPFRGASRMVGGAPALRAGILPAWLPRSRITPGKPRSRVTPRKMPQAGFDSNLAWLRDRRRVSA